MSFFAAVPLYNFSSFLSMPQEGCVFRDCGISWVPFIFDKNSFIIQ